MLRVRPKDVRGNESGRHQIQALAIKSRANKTAGPDPKVTTPRADDCEPHDS